MKFSTIALRGGPAASGFSYVEVVLALLLLVIGIVPAVNAVRDSLAAPQIAQAAAQALQCVKNHMEKVIAEPYRKLSNAHALFNVAVPAYSLPADAQCAAREVFITYYDPDAVAPYFVAIDKGLLLVRVATPGSAMTFSTLVAR